MSETPLPDLEEVVTVDLTPVTVTMEEAQEEVHEVQEVVEEVERRNPFLLVRRPLVPDSVLYKWQRGFRRDATGRYNKVISKTSLSLFRKMPICIRTHRQRKAY